MDRINVLVVEDSIFMQRVIQDILKRNKAIEVTATVDNGEKALIVLKQKKIDVVIMDVEMPGMDGLKALKKIMETRPVPVIMISSYTKQGTSQTIQSLSIGAVDFITKPTAEQDEDLKRFAMELQQKIIMASTVMLKDSGTEECPVKRAVSTGYFDRGVVKYVVAVGLSTGGPKALQRVLPVIPEVFEGAIAIVQHMPSGFTKSLAKRLDSLCQIRVKEAKHNERLEAGHCYIAPGGYHMRIIERTKKGEYAISIDDGPFVSGHRPSVDVLFESLSSIRQLKTVAVIMTGMGSDGSAGLAKLKKMQHTLAIAQDEKSSTVFGMPGSAIKSGLIDKVIDLDEIGVEILKSLEV